MKVLRSKPFCAQQYGRKQAWGHFDTLTSAKVMSNRTAADRTALCAANRTASRTALPRIDEEQLRLALLGESNLGFSPCYRNHPKSTASWIFVWPTRNVAVAKDAKATNSWVQNKIIRGFFTFLPEITEIDIDWHRQSLDKGWITSPRSPHVTSLCFDICIKNQLRCIKLWHWDIQSLFSYVRLQFSWCPFASQMVSAFSS